jgi:predicted nucleotidyltransferase
MSTFFFQLKWMVLAFFGLVGKLENALHKKVDVIRFKDLTKDQDFLDEIMKTGIRIYG